MENKNKFSDEFNKKVDEWLLRRNELRGEIIIPQIGNVPPPQSGLYGINNELITKDLIRHYADAIGDRNPLWRSEEYAQKTRWGSIVAPPTAIECIGSAGEGRGESPPPFFTKLRGGSKTQWFRPIRPGDKFHVIGTEMGVEEKRLREERPYRLFSAKIRTDYVNQREETVATKEDSYVMVVAPTKDQAGAGFGDKKQHKYTPEELDHIHRCYEEEKRRGADTLFWEDVAEGEELTPIVAGPLDTLDCHVFMGVLGYQVAFGLKWERIKDLIDDHCWHDPETNTPRWQAEVHLTNACARAMGISGGGIGLDAQFEGMLCHLICNWMGDDGFLKMLDCQSRRPNWHGDTSWMKGKVTKKYVDNSEHLVDLDLHCENQDSVVHMISKATVRLVSRVDL